MSGFTPSGKPRLLFLCQTLPFPPDGGVNIRTYNILRILAREFDINALCFYRRSDRTDTHAVRKGIEGLSPFATVEAFPISQEHRRIRLLWDHLRSVITRHAFTDYVYESGPFKKRLAALLRQHTYSLVHVDSLDLAPYLRLLSALPVACTHHNVESALLRRRSEQEVGWRRTYINWQGELVERVERSWCGRVALNVAVSDLDAEHLQRLAPSARFTVVPNGVDVETFQPGDPGDDGLVFVGGANWFPNRDALMHFSQEILPEIRNAAGAVPIRWIGRSSDEDRERYGREYGIELTGYVDDVRPYIQRAACYVAPLRVGGGTRLKILDAWAMGKAVVSTSVACEGLEAVDGQNIVIHDDPREFARAVVRLLNDPGARAKLGREARRTVVRRYSWDVIAEELLASYQRLLDRRAPARTP